jgi:hypothetical protein
MSATHTLPGRMVRFVIFTPFKVSWRVVTAVCNAIGILMSLLLGALLVTLGYFLMSTIIGAVIGLPLFVIGVFLLLRALY